MHPTLNANSIKHQVMLLLRAAAFLPTIRRWYDISDNPLLQTVLEKYPLIHGMIYWPYIHYTWSLERRLATIDQHYRMLQGTSTIIAQATFREVELARLDKEFSGLRLVLDKAAWFMREGEVVLNLFVNEQRIYSVAFTLGIYSDQPLVMVGGLQGLNSEVARDTYRDITHALHGMRPRDFLLVSLKLLCKELEIDVVWAISDEFRHYNSTYFGARNREKVLVAYDEIWQEHGGTVLDNGFFEIPVRVTRKDMSEIPSRKRAAYRRRYEMLDKLAIDIKRTCDRYASQDESNCQTNMFH